MRKTQKLVSIVLSLVMILSCASVLVSCAPQTGEFDVWTMPSTTRILQGKSYPEYSENNSKRLEYSMAINEYESKQVIITPDYDVRKYNATVSDLTGANGKTISKDNITIYNQYYIDCSFISVGNTRAEKGFYPDALVPLNKAVEYGENKITKGNNQGLWLTIYTPKGTEASTYTGSLTLTVDGKNSIVPITVEVWDYTLTDANHLKSALSDTQEYTFLAYGDNSVEGYERVRQEYLKYRLSSDKGVSATNTSFEEKMQAVIRHVTDERVTSCSIGNDYGYEEELRYLIEHSTPGTNLIEKVKFYIFDEPVNQIEDATRVNRELTDMLIRVANEYEEKGLLDDYGLTKDDIQGVEILSTVSINNFGGKKVEGLRTYCPLTGEFHTEADRQMYEEQRQNVYLGANNELEGTDYGTTWWYYCNHPHDPYPSAQIDTYLSSVRVLEWMAYEYDIEGFLTCDSAWFMDPYLIGQMDTIGVPNKDVYQNGTQIYRNANGVLYIFYPGLRYGEAELYPSMRVMGIRDGYEEYEMLYYVEELAQEYLEKYGMESLKEVLKTAIFSKLYEGVLVYDNPYLVDNAREVLREMIELLKSDAHAIVKIEEPNYITKTVDINVYAENGTTVTVNGNEIAPQASHNGSVFTITVPATESTNSVTFTIKNGDQSFTLTKSVGPKVELVTDMENASDISKFTASKRVDGSEHILVEANTDSEYVYNGTKSMKVTVQAKDWTEMELVSYLPSITIGKDDIFPAGYKNYDMISVRVYNPASEKVSVSVRLNAIVSGAKKNKIFAKYTLLPGWNEIKLTELYAFNWKVQEVNYADFISALTFEFGLLEKDIVLYFDFICANHKEG